MLDVGRFRSSIPSAPLSAVALAKADHPPVRRSLGVGGSSLIPHPFRRGFTLIELLTVMAIMMIMMGLSIAAFANLGKAAGMRAAVLQFRTGLSLARQVAITQRTVVRFHYRNETNESARGVYFLSKSPFPAAPDTIGIALGTTNYFKGGILFTNETVAAPYVEFRMDGSCRETTFGKPTNTNLRVVSIAEQSANGVVTALKVYPMTGRIRVVTGQP